MVWYTRLVSKLAAAATTSSSSSSTLFKNLSTQKHPPLLKPKHSFSNHFGGYKSPPPLIISSKNVLLYPNNLYKVKHYKNIYGGQAWRKTISYYAPTKTCISQQIIPSWVYKCIPGCFLLVVVPVGVVLYNTHETIPYTNRTHFVLLPPSEDKYLGEEIFKKMELDLLPEDHPDSVRVKSIGEQIVKALESDLEAMKQGKSWKKPTVDHLVGLKWVFLVANDTRFTENCGSVPGGKIYVSSDMLKHFESDADIATLIGHEVGHVVARHVPGRLNMLVLAVNLGLPKSIQNKIVNDPDGVPGLGRFLFTYPGWRREVIEADYIGLLLMASAGFDPQEAPKVYEMFDQLSPSSKSDFYRTHPSGKKRAKALAKVMEEAKSIYSETSVTRKKVHEDC